MVALSAMTVHVGGRRGCMPYKATVTMLPDGVNERSPGSRRPAPNETLTCDDGAELHACSMMERHLVKQARRSGSLTEIYDVVG